VKPEFLPLLSKRLDWKVRENFVAAYEAMWRDLDYQIRERKSPTLKLMATGWKKDRLRTIAVLNAFNRTVLGPLAAAAGRTKGTELGLSRPIHYGTEITISADANSDIRAALADFEEIRKALKIPPKCLHVSRMADMVYYLNRKIDGGF